MKADAVMKARQAMKDIKALKLEAADSPPPDDSGKGERQRNRCIW